jgi:hypothetical protein
MSRSRRTSREEDSTTVVAPIGVGPMSPTVVGVDEVVGEDDGDAGDGLVLDVDEGGRQAAAAAMGVAAAATEEERRQRLVRSAAAVLEVGEEPESVMKTGADGGVPAPGEAARRIPRKVDAR